VGDFLHHNQLPKKQYKVDKGSIEEQYIAKKSKRNEIGPVEVV
jgi:hypothetical protein